MPRKLHNALTALAVKNAGPGRHADGGGLHLLVKDSGARSWVFRFMLNGKSRDLGLGAAGQGGLTLSQARNRATELRLKVKAGVDPLAERAFAEAEAKATVQAAKAAGVTFKEMAETHIKANRDSWRNAKHQQQWENTLANYAYPVIGNLPVAEVDTTHVLQILEPIWKEKTETASRLRGRIETVLDSAKARGLRQGENPARWRGHPAAGFVEIAKGYGAETHQFNTDLPVSCDRFDMCHLGNAAQLLPKWVGELIGERPVG